MQKQIHKHPQPSLRRCSIMDKSLYNAYRGILPTKNTNLAGGSCMTHPYKMLCPTCRKANKMTHPEEHCAICGTTLLYLASRVRLPRKQASDRTWIAFLKIYTRPRVPYA